MRPTEPIPVGGQPGQRFIVALNGLEGDRTGICISSDSGWTITLQRPHGPDIPAVLWKLRRALKEGLRTFLACFDNVRMRAPSLTGALAFDVGTDASIELSIGNQLKLEKQLAAALDEKCTVAMEMELSGEFFYDSFGEAVRERFEDWVAGAYAAGQAIRIKVSMTPVDRKTDGVD